VIFMPPRLSMNASRYPEAIDLLTRLVRQPLIFFGEADALEMLGPVRELSGHTFAPSEGRYRSYLQRYPQGAGAERVGAYSRRWSPVVSQPRSVESAVVKAGLLECLVGTPPFLSILKESRPTTAAPLPYFA